MNNKAILALLAAASVLLGCDSSPDVSKAPTAQEVKSFKGTPLTPEQAARLRGAMGGGPAKTSVPAPSGPAQSPSDK